MVDGLFFCATLTGRREGHTPLVQAGAETSDTGGAEAVKPDPDCSWEAAPSRREVLYSAVERTWAGVGVPNVVAQAPQPEPASRLKSAKRDGSFLQSDSRCGKYVSGLSNVTSRYLGSGQKGRISLL